MSLRSPFSPAGKTRTTGIARNKPKLEDPFVQVNKGTKPEVVNPFDQISEQRKIEHKELSIADTSDIDCFNAIVQTYISRRTWMADRGLIEPTQLLEEVKRANEFFATMSKHIK